MSDTHLSFKNPVSYFDKNTTSLISLVDELFSVVPDAKLFIFGSIDEYMCASGLVDENSGFAPVSPYGISRVASHMYCNYMIGYKKANIYYGVFSSHESILRDRKFFTAKIPEKIIKYLQSGTSFQVGDLSPLRDWGYAPEYMDIVSDLMESTAPYGEYFITTTILVSCEDYLNSFLTNAGIKYNLKKDFSGIHYFDESSGKLICSSVNSQFSNNFSHPSTSNDKLRSAIGRVPMKGVSDIIDEYISYYNFPNY